ncbi:MAG: hypothetical protein MR952_10515 [Flavonifractor plautii]|nr:hypothetical protein [Flavonifractor plautii]
MPVNDCGNNCTLKTRVDRLEKDFEAEKETNSQRHAEFYARIGKLEQVQAVSGTRLDTIMDKLDSIALDLTALKEKPSKRWETVVAALITGVVGYLLAAIGLH